jgi:hypothetical protein
LSETTDRISAMSSGLSGLCRFPSLIHISPRASP